MRWLVAVLTLALATGCSTGLAAPDAPEVGGPVRASGEDVAQDVSPTGSVTVAQPNPVGTWWQRSVEDLGAGDLAPLWSLPLYRTDPLGRAVPALARAARVVADEEGAWTVEVDLAAGTWSDGEPVTADDVVATAEALATARPEAWAAWTDATAADADTARLAFDRPFNGWKQLLSEAPGVLPAHVLAEEGLAAYDDALPVTGGWFTLAEHQPGVSARFSAHSGSPLGAPALATVEVLVVPGTDTALGLLADGTADMALGHVVIDPTRRRAEVDGLEGANPLGGTRFELVWPGGAGTVAQRVAVAARLDPAPFVDGLLREVGRRPGGLLPAHEPLPRPSLVDAEGSVAVQLPRTVEGLGLLARRLQADLEGAGAEVALVRLDPPEHLDPPVATDAHLRIVRVPPGRSMAALLASVGLDPAAGIAADAAGTSPLDPLGVGVVPGDELQPVIDLLAEDPRVLPVAEVAVAHWWHPERVSGVAPSAWPGIGFWNAGEWTAGG